MMKERSDMGLMWIKMDSIKRNRGVGGVYTKWRLWSA